MDLVWDSSSVVQSFNHTELYVYFLYNMIVKLIKKIKEVVKDIV
jgi:hypothetical protein